MILRISNKPGAKPSQTGYVPTIKGSSPKLASEFLTLMYDSFPPFQKLSAYQANGVAIDIDPDDAQSFIEILERYGFEWDSEDMDEIPKQDDDDE